MTMRRALLPFGLFLLFASCGGELLKRWLRDSGPGDVTRSEEAVTAVASLDADAAVEAPSEGPPRPYVACRSVPRDELPEEETVIEGGRLVIRVTSMVIDDAEDEVSVCTVEGGVLPDGAQLVGVYGEEGWSAGLWSPREERELDTYADDELPVVVLERPVAALRAMRYCPTDPRHACLVAGSERTVEAFESTDPNGPRSGWDFAEEELPIVAARTDAGEGVAFCGATVHWRGLSLVCADVSPADRTSCIQRFAVRELADLPPEEQRSVDLTAQQREVLASRWVLSDGEHEVAVPGHEVYWAACVDGHVLVQLPYRFGASVEGFVAVELEDGHLRTARRMTAREHEEDSGGCVYGWDDISLVPVVRGGRIAGGVLAGIGAPVLFEFGRGDAGDVRLPRLDVDSLTRQPVMPPAYRQEGSDFTPVMGAGESPAHCPLRVMDPDGHTNVRPSPDTRRTPVGTLPNGTIIEAMEQRGPWYRVEAPLAGWVFAGGLRRSCDEAPRP